MNSWYFICIIFFFFLMIRRPPRSTLSSSSAASDVYKRQAWVMEGYDTERINSASRIKNVFACWNGGVASKAALFYNGIRFREGMKELGQEDCSQSECSLWSMDAHKLGYHNIIIDPSVQSGYAWSNYINNFRDSSPEVKAGVYSPNVYKDLSLIHISEPTRLLSISYAVFCLKKKKKKQKTK
eukprot:TRINITY_DN22144_c0_g1_i1.p1 TRINITY_DN22144_c0_g1~~TRINITY_DN22144_c0_g1_i1.p1  ORF type:complete len:183 (+),score=62.93 TRINITY_DN22144_c0_g1_i1:99-647(+)